MSNVVSGLGRDVGSMFNRGGRAVGGAKSWLEQQWSQRLIQISVFASIVFWILGSYKLINQVDGVLTKTFSLKLGNDGTRGLHAVIFGFFMYTMTRFILDPFVNQAVGGLVEGMSKMKEHEKDK